MSTIPPFITKTVTPTKMSYCVMTRCGEFCLSLSVSTPLQSAVEYIIDEWAVRELTELHVLTAPNAREQMRMAATREVMKPDSHEQPPEAPQS